MFNKIRSAVERFCKSISVISAVVIFVISVVIVIDILIRSTTRDMAVMGTYELTELAMVAIIFLSLAITQIEKEHIRVEMLIRMLPFRAKSFVNTIISLISTAVSCMLLYASILSAIEFAKSGTYTSVLFIPIFPFKWILSLGIFTLTIVLLFDTIDCFIKTIGGGSVEH